MSRLDSIAEALPERWTARDYLQLVERGAFGPDDRAELLEGVIVAMAPHDPPHATGCSLAHEAIRAAVGARAAVRAQLSLVLGGRSVPEPDVAVVPGRLGDYANAHPTTALLVVEVADSSLIQDRLTKASIYAAAGVPEYWIVNLVDDCVEVLRLPERPSRLYASKTLVRRGGSIELVSLPGARVMVAELLPVTRSSEVA